jgi:hypothetical protein
MVQLMCSDLYAPKWSVPDTASCGVDPLDVERTTILYVSDNGDISLATLEAARQILQFDLGYVLQLIWFFRGM